MLYYSYLKKEGNIMSIKIAISKKKLDTPLPIYLSGYGARKDYAHSIHDDLYANSVFITDGEKNFAMVSCDLLGIYAGYYRPIIDDIKKRVGIKGLDIVITNVHSHSAPALRDSEYDTNIEMMIEEVKQKVAEGIREAASKAKEVKIGFNQKLVRGVGANRRDSKIDVNTVLKIMTFKQNGNQGVAVNFNCHPTLMSPSNMQVSKDYQGYTMDKLVDDGFLPLYLQGACGDVSTRFTRTAQTFEECDRLGGILADEVKSLVEATESRDISSFSYVEHIVKLPKKQYENEEYYLKQIKEYEKTLADKKDQVSAAELRIYETALQGINVEYRYSQSQDKIVTDIPCGVLRLDNNVVIFAPFEIFSKVADRIYAGSKAENTLVVGYSFDGQGYLPDAESFDNGGYEVLSCRYARGAGEVFADEVIKLING